MLAQGEVCSGSVFTNWTNQAPGLLPAACIWKYELGEPARNVKGSDWKENSRMEPSAVAPQAHRYGWCPQGTLPRVDLNSAGHIWRLLPEGKYTNPLLHVYLLMAGVIITASVYLFRAALCFLQSLLPAWSQGKIFLGWMVMAQAPCERGNDSKWCRNKRNNPPGCITCILYFVGVWLCLVGLLASFCALT